MRTFLLVIFLLATLVVVGISGFYCWASCALPKTGVVALPDQGVLPASEKGADGAVDWRARTLIDLAAAQREIWDNSPVPYDNENPQYRRWAVEGFEAAKARAEKVTDLTGYFFTLAAYINGFGDPHFQFSLEGALPTPMWPGFIVARKGDNAEVVFRDPTDTSAPPVGATIVSCDGKALPALLDERIFPFRLNPKLASDRRIAMTRLFINRGNPFAPAPSECEFRDQGHWFKFKTSWRATPAADDDPWWKEYAAASTGPSAEWGVTEPQPGVFWIGVPTFASGDDTAPKLDALIKDVSARAEAMRKGRAIVIDTRGNGGGNSMWAHMLAEVVFTKSVLSRRVATPRASAVDWRASPANAAFWRDWSEQMTKEFGPFSVNRIMALYLGWQLERSSKDDPPMWREILSSCKTAPAGGLTKERPKGDSPFPARVFFLSNGSCGSSCLNFADTVLMVPGVKLIGSATSGDGPYMDIRIVKLPSKVAAIAFGQKVERGSGRGPLEAYEPDVAYDGSWSDKAVRAWVLEQAAK
jgi:hypothetical protein